ncbi:MAG: hypothetical protein NPIRA04_18360 [Nitrospirales bacterium]|nr:MAG: hypothetical protein NPIRA04_18360 [Nitrospirales bacterium]
MIAHQTIAVNHHAKAFMGIGKRRQKGLAVGRGAKDPLIPSSAIHDMIIRILVFNANGSGHGILYAWLYLIKQAT